MNNHLRDAIEIRAPLQSTHMEILTPQALDFVAGLQREFGHRRQELLKLRVERQAELDAGILPDFLASTAMIRSDPGWQVASTPPELQKRRVEITGPTDRKMMINALNSGASIFMADFEDANSPTWSNLIEGQINVRDAINGRITYSSPEGKSYALKEQVAVLMVRPRGWHLEEKHLLLDGEQVSASLFDFGLFMFHNARRLIEKGSGPYLYLPKLENHLEARLWNDVFLLAQEQLGLPRGSIRATVLIETILAAFEMEEILYELREHSAGLNAGRWDYIFSTIKKFSNREDFIFPDRGQITMTVPFMRAYTELLVKTCHRRGAHAIGGMAAFIPSRKDAEVNELALERVREDKLREAGDGFDGTWVAHPDLVSTAMDVFDQELGDRPHQKERLREELQVHAADLIDFRVPGGEISEAGLRQNINIGLQYLDSWLRGIGAAAIYNLMEDAATAEISRAQVWQWIHRPAATLTDERRIDVQLVRRMIPEELEKIQVLLGEKVYAAGKFELASQIFDRLVTDDDFAPFLTIPAYQYLE